MSEEALQNPKDCIGLVPYNLSDCVGAEPSGRG